MRNRQSDLDDDDLAERKGLNVGGVIFELCAATEADVAFGYVSQLRRKKKRVRRKRRRRRRRRGRKGVDGWMRLTAVGDGLDFLKGNGSVAENRVDSILPASSKHGWAWKTSRRPGNVTVGPHGRRREYGGGEE